MDDAKQQLFDKLKTANNILVTVSRDPSVDQLSALLGLTLFLNKQGKHAAAVFSGKVPSTLEFLQPGETIETNTDSLRDFIISLDKNKADKLRYKVEDNVVRIFITPYKTSISQDDFDFTQGDFNVDLVIAIGVQQQEDLDEAITAHGRILHDATVASINTTAEGGLGTINWHDPQASSLSELATRLAQDLDAKLLDQQIATALLTGIVAETDRFSNDKTSSQTMSASAALMAAGANQQLVASKLEEEPDDDSGTATQDPGDDSQEPSDGAIDIDHGQDKEEEEPDETSELELPGPETGDLPEDIPEPADKPDEPGPAMASDVSDGPKLVTEPPTMGGVLTANSIQQALDPVTDPFSLPNAEPPQLLDHKDYVTVGTPAVPDPQFTPPPPAWVPPAPDPVNLNPPAIDASADDVSNQTLTEIEQSVQSPHSDVADLDDARDEVSRALNDSSVSNTMPPEPIQALNAQPMGDDLRAPEPQTPQAGAPAPQVIDPSAPPPVPPPIPFQFGNPPQQQ